MGISKKVKKIAAIGGGALALGGLGYGAAKLLKKKGKRGMPSQFRRARGIGRLRTQVQRLAYKIKKKQLQRKLFKEEMRV